MKTEINVGHLSRRRALLKVSHKTPVSEVIEKMVKNRMTAACVMRREQLVGIFTMSDVMRRVLGLKVTSIWRRHQQRKIRDVSVAEIMTEEPVTISADAGVSQAMELMRTYKVRHLPVLADNHLVGIVTLKDVAQALEAGDRKSGASKQRGLQLMYNENLLLSPVLVPNKRRT